MTREQFQRADVVMIRLHTRDNSLGRPWLALCFALAAHLAEQAHVGFLPVYNDAVRAVGSLLPIVSKPGLVLAVGMWLAVGLVGAFTALLPYAYRGSRWMRLATIGLSLIVLANVTGYIGGSTLAGSLLPGMYTLPLLLGTGIYALVVAWRWSPSPSREQSPA
jgi:hypothetical protein